MSNLVNVLKHHVDHLVVLPRPLQPILRLLVLVVCLLSELVRKLLCLRVNILEQLRLLDNFSLEIITSL